MQWYGSECVYQHEGRTVTPNHQTNELEKKVEVLKTLVIKMAKKEWLILKLNSKLK